MDIKNLIDEFLMANSHLSKSSQQMYGYGLKSFADYWEAQAPAGEEVDYDGFLSEFCQALAETGKSSVTIRQYLTIVKMFLKSQNILTVFSYKTPAGEKKKQQLKSLDRWFDEKEVETILAHTFSSSNGKALRNQLLIRLLFESGARIREIAGLTADDFSLTDRWFFIRESKTVPRPAFYGDKTAEIIQKLIAGCQFSGRIFPDVAQCKTVFNQMLMDLGLKTNNDGRGPHTARHYVATRLKYDGGVALEDIAMLLGDEPETIRSVYLHPSARQLQKIVAPMIKN